MPVFSRSLIGLAVGACFAAGVNANPSGPTVVHGSASFATSGNTLTVTNTPGTIINWQQFSIRPDEVTRFIQSGAASAVLNRVTGAEASSILGQLLSNGRVFLINPNGVTIGAGARIDTAGFVASSLAMSNEDFLGGRFRFSDPGSAGKITNAGTIHAHSGGPVYLVAPTVENHGVINAPNGDVLLAAGKSVELVAAASPHLRVQVEAGGDTVNVGQLVAESGRVGLYGAAIRNAGTISADSASVNAAGNVVLKASRDVTLEAGSVVSASGANGGSVHLHAERGTLLAEGRVVAQGSAGRGGEVKLLGEQVGLVGNARVDASGARGGGSVHVGGSRQGAGPLPNSRAIFLGTESAIDASATVSGDGGTVIAYADEAARIYGRLSARGGPAGGDGGFIETSGRQHLEILQTPDATAAAGRGGEWLIDPNNIQIVTAAGTCTNLSGCAAGPNWSSTNDNAQLGVNLINNALNAGQNVTIATTASGANTQAGNITFQANANVSKTAVGSADATLTLVAHNNIDTTGATISAANNVNVGRLNVVLTADADNSGAGNVVIGSNITTRGGAVTATGVNISGTGQIVTTGIGGRAGGDVSLTATGTISHTGAITASGATGPGAATGGAGGSVALTGATINRTAGAITARGGNGGTNAAGGNGGAITVTRLGGAGSVTLAGNLDTRGGNSNGTGNGGTSGAVTIHGAGGNVTVGGTINTTGGRGQDAGAVTISTTGAVAVNNTITASGGTAATNADGRAGGAVSISGSTVATRAITASGSNAVSANRGGGNAGSIALTSTAGGVTINAGGALTARAGAATGTGTGGLAGSISLNATGGNVTANAITTQGNAKTDGGAVTVAATGTATTAAITTTGGAGISSAGRSAGAVSVSGATVTVGAITAGGGAGAGTNQNGGAAGAITLDATGGAPLITLNGNLAAAGGNATGTGTGGAGGTITIADAVVFNANRTINASPGTGGAAPGGNVTFAGTVDSQTPTARTLAVNTTGVTRFAGAVGGVNALASVTTNAGGTTRIDGGLVRTTGAQTYGDAVTLGADTTLTSTGGGNIAFASTVNAFDATARALTVNTTGTNTFGGAVGGTNALASLTTSAGGTTVVNGGLVRTTGDQTYNDALTLGGATTLRTTANGNLSANAAVTATAGTLTLDTGTGSATLTNAGNNFSTVTVTSGGAVHLVDQNALALGTVNAGTFRARTLSGNLTLNGAIAVTGAGDSIVLAPAANLVNGAGAGALNPGGGRWLVYLASPANADAVNGPASGNQAVWGVTYPGAVAVPGDRYVFANTPTITLTTTDAPNKTYGDVADVSTSFTASGFVNAASFGNVFTQDSVANALSGLSVTSAGAPATANAGTYSIVAMATPTTGYALTINNTGQLVVDPRPITITPGPLARPYGDPNPATTGTLAVGGAGLVNGNTITQVDVSSPATAADPAGSTHSLTASNPVFGGGGLASNYAITYAPGVLTIGQRPITVQANDQARVYGDPNPAAGPYTITAGSLAGADSITDVTLTSPATVLSGVGSYALAPTAANFGTGSAANYAITFADGVLTVTPRPVAVAADNQTKVYGQTDPALTFTAATVNGDVLNGALARAPGETVAGGPYAITQGTVTNANNPNYLITFTDGQLVITPAPLTIAANDAARAAGQPNPPFTATATGLQLGDTLASLNGVLLITTPATPASPVGAYPITPSGVSSANYTITFVDGTLVVTPDTPQTTGPAGGGDRALVTALDRSADGALGTDQRNGLPGVDCLLLVSPGGQRVLGRCNDN
jgi:filamentous hemagglutinin family protein